MIKQLESAIAIAALAAVIGLAVWMIIVHFLD